MDREVILTEEGYNKLQDEIEYLTTKKRREVAERIKTAREFGDISENSEYDDAKNEQAHVETRIIQIEHQLRNASIIDPHDVPMSEVVSSPARVTTPGEPSGTASTPGQVSPGSRTPGAVVVTATASEGGGALLSRITKYVPAPRPR